MLTALQMGQRQMRLRQILEHLTKSAFLPQYLESVILEETLNRWQQSPEYSIACAADQLQDLDLEFAQLSHSQQGDGSIQLVEATKRSRILQQYKQAHWRDRVLPHFIARKSQLDRVIFSAIQVERIGMAQELYLRVKDRKQSFDKLARLYSQGAEAKMGGVMGPIPVEQLDPDIIYHLTNLEPGELSPLFYLNNLHTFIRLEQRLPAQFDEETKQQLLEELFQDWLHQEIEDRIATLDLTTLLPIEHKSSNLLTAIIPLEDRDLQILPQSQVEPIATNKDRSPATIQPTISFILPASDAPVSDGLDHDFIVTSSFFLPQSTPNQVIDLHPQDRNVAFQRVVTFIVFLCLFLGGAYGAVYLLNFLNATNTIQVDRSQ